MSWKYFLGSCILAAGLLFKLGAPVVPVVAGIVIAGCLNWVKTRTH